MTTESNENNYTANMATKNLEEITEKPPTKQTGIYQERLNEFCQPKKRYYLASCDENIGMLKKEQEQGLTDILIALKKDYDNIKMESQKVANETAMLEKKIIMIQQMDARTEKKNVESKFQNENIKKAIEFTRERLKEEEYKKKTLTALLSKIKKDINISELSLQKSYDKQNILNQKLQRQKLLENEIKAKGNQINSQISSQKEKNKRDQNEYNLQVQYYNTIIEQKMDFIRAAEERKERQLKIAQDAKKTSGDKDEKEKREKLQLFYLINKFLQKKMENELEKNREIEDAFSKIRLICGTNNLKIMIDKILDKDKKYNYTIKQINEKEEQKKILTKEIDELQEKFNKLKNEIVVDIDTINKKDIQIIKSKDFETSLNNELLINEEIELNDKYNLNKEINNLVNLRYDQVINSLRKLCTEQSIKYMKNVSLNASLINNQSKVNNKEENINDSNEEENKEENKDINNEENKDIKIGENKDDGGEENKDINKEDKKEENVENKYQKSQESSQAVILKDKLVYSEGQDNSNKKSNNNINIEDNNNNISNNNMSNNIAENQNENQNNPDDVANNDTNINNNNYNNSNVNINNSSNIYSNSISLLDINEEKKLIQSYKDYLAQAEDTINKLFLMKTKNDFFQMIRDKASEFEDANKTIRIIKRFQDKNNKKKINVSKSVAIPKENSELEYCADDIENSKENEIQEKIFRTYMNAERRKMEKFINNEKETRIIKNKDS